jgi:hypothetical protein
MRPLNSSQKTAVQPLLDVLIARYSEVAETGETKRADPLCAEAGVGRCFACPVFGEEARGPGRMIKYGKSEPVYVPGPWYHCDETLPAPPVCVDDRHDGVDCGPKPDAVSRWGKKHSQAGEPRYPGRKTSREQARAWGAEMVAFFEGLRMNDEGGEP